MQRKNRPKHHETKISNQTTNLHPKLQCVLILLMQKGVQQDARMSAPGLALGKQAKRQNDQ